MAPPNVIVAMAVTDVTENSPPIAARDRSRASRYSTRTTAHAPQNAPYTA